MSEQTPEAVTTHEEHSVDADGSETHTLDTTEATGDAAEEAVSEPEPDES